MREQLDRIDDHLVLLHEPAKRGDFAHAFDRGEFVTKVPVLQTSKIREIDPARLSEFSTELDSEYYEVLGRENWLDSKRSPGGTSASSLKLQLDRAGRALAAMRP